VALKEKCKRPQAKYIENERKVGRRGKEKKIDVDNVTIFEQILHVIYIIIFTKLIKIV